VGEGGERRLRIDCEYITTRSDSAAASV